jgi:hypothetical protein
LVLFIFLESLKVLENCKSFIKRKIKDSLYKAYSCYQNGKMNYMRIAKKSAIYITSHLLSISRTSRDIQGYYKEVVKLELFIFTITI